jgi:lipid-A-disaccharide synthase
MTECAVTRHFFIIAGEESGDRLGGSLIRSLQKHGGPIQFSGVGGHEMSAAGLCSLFPMEDLAVMGIFPVVARLPRLVRRIYDVVDAVKRLSPEVLVLIDSPEFTHAVARRVRRFCPHILIINYVSPSVWAWRSGRARRMIRYIDHVLALFPFEPEVYRRLQGPPCHYVGHPVADRMRGLSPASQTQGTVLLMPGSRRSEVLRLLPIFREVMTHLHKKNKNVRWVIPTTPRMLSFIKGEIACWSRIPEVVCGTSETLYPLFAQAQAALVASGTATLELAFSSVPMVVAYKVSHFEAFLARWLVRVPVVSLPNIILHFMYGQSAIYPEFLQNLCTVDRLSSALEPLLEKGSAQWCAQYEAFMRIHNAFLVESQERDMSCADVAAQTLLRLSSPEV